MTEKLSQQAIDALAARDRQYRTYAKRKKIAMAQLCASDPDGERLRQFDERLASYKRLEDADDFLAFIKASATWLRAASADCKHTAFGLIADRISGIRTAHRLAPFDDPLPGDDDDSDIFQIAKKVLV